MSKALRVSPADAAALGLTNGARARITTAGGSAEACVEVNAAMQPGHASLPNGFGLNFTDAAATQHHGCSAQLADVDRLAGRLRRNAWHKHVPARIEAVPPSDQLSAPIARAHQSSPSSRSGWW